MNPNYYTVERQCSPIRTQGSPVWFRLTYRREWMAERGLWRDTLVNEEMIGKR
jgi:hypothetical protein